MLSQYASNDPANITASHRQVGKSTRMGFETTIMLDGKRIPRYVKAFALDKHGEVQGATASIDIVSGKTHGESSSIWRLATDTESESGARGLVEESNESEEDAAASYRMSLTSVVALLMTIIMWHMF